MGLKSLLNIGIKMFRGSSAAKTAVKVGAAAIGTAAVGVGTVFTSNLNLSNYSIKDQNNADTFLSSDPNNRTREQVYSLIEEICVKYNINPQDAKNAMLLETIAGCTTEELLTKSNEELENIIKAFDNALPWKIFSWGDKDINFVKDIAQKANKKYVAGKTGISTWSDTVRDIKHFFGVDTDVKSTLEDNGFSITPDGMKKYFDSMMKDAIASGDKEKIKENYDLVLQKFGELLNDTEDPYQKEILQAAISRLEAPKRAMAAKLSIASCGDNDEAKQAVARGISKHFEEISCIADALGQYTSDDDNTTISHTSFANMTEEDSMIALGRMNSRRQELEAKIANGEELTEAESRYYNNAQLSQYAGAMTGTVCNSYVENPATVLNTIDRDTAEFGIQQEVYSRAASYVEEHQQELPMTPAQFTATVDRATGNNYTKVLNDIKAGVPEVRPSKTQTQAQTKIQQTNETNTKKADAQQGTETISETTTPVKQEKQRVSAVTNPAERQRTGTPSTQQTTTATATVSNKKTSDKAQTNTVTNPSATKREFSQEKLNEAISQGIEGITAYKKDYDISDIKLTQEILNSTVASSSLQDWALEKFKRMNVALKKLTFPGIHNEENLKKAALMMNPEDLKEMNMTSYYTEKTVDRIIEREEKAV